MAPTANSVSKYNSFFASGKLWPWLLMLGPLLVIIAGGYTSWLAFSRPDALVVDDYYKQGKAINQDLQRDRKAAALEIRFAAHYTATAARIQGMISQPQSTAAHPLRLRFIHPTLPKRDIELALYPDNAGQFDTELPPNFEQIRWQILLEDPAQGWRLTGIWQPQTNHIQLP